MFTRFVVVNDVVDVVVVLVVLLRFRLLAKSLTLQANLPNLV